MHILLKILVSIISITFVMDIFAATKITPLVISTGSTTTESGSNILNNSGGLTESGTIETNTGTKQETIEEKKDKEKTINDINAFLIESYKLKIDRILSDLSTSLERVTNNNPEAQAKLLWKIRGDINTKIQIINSRHVSENRKKILSSIFNYIQENLDAQIVKLVGQK